MEAFELSMTTILVLVAVYLIMWAIIGNAIQESSTVHLLSGVISIIVSIVYAYFEEKNTW